MMSRRRPSGVPGSAGACLALLLLLAGGAARAQVTGVVVDSASLAPLPGARVQYGAVLTSTDALGRFRVMPGSAAVVTRVGYRPACVAARDGEALRVLLVRLPTPLDPIVVTVAREAADPLASPAAITAIAGANVRSGAPALSPVDHVRGVAGVEMASKGLIQRTYAARGFLGANSDALLVLTDFRPSAVASLRFNVPYLVPGTDADVERIELQRGPGAALYGPGSDRGILHVITRSPFESRGGSLSLTGGSRELFDIAARWAGAGERLGAKLSLGYTRGRDWPGGAGAGEVVARDPMVERAAADARFDWRADGAEVVASGGIAWALRAADLTPAGPYQLRNFRTFYVQTRLRRGGLFANLLYNGSHAGETVNVETGGGLADRSRQVMAQVQQSFAARAATLTGGVDLRVTDPRTAGTIHGRFENDDDVREAGGFVSGALALRPAVDLVAALRVDRHSHLGGGAVSPRVGVVVRPRPAHAFRLTWNRAFATPSPATLFADFVAAPFGATPFNLRVSGIPRGGFTFDTGCGGPCMRAPAAYGADPATPMPADGTLLWGVLQARLNAADVPAPGAAQVPSTFALFDITSGGFSPAAAVPASLAPNRREVTQALELGYRGLVDQRLVVEADLHWTRVGDVIGTLNAVTPNVFLDGAALAQYLRGFRPAAVADSLAAIGAQVPLGTIAPREAAGADLLLASPQGGAYAVWGFDLAVAAQATEQLSLRGSVSLSSRDSATGIAGGTTVTLGVPRRKGSAAVRWSREDGRLFEVRYRTLGSVVAGSGLGRGRVRGYSSLDGTAAVRLGAAGPTATLSVQNLLDARHREWPGAPILGRLILLRLQRDF